MRTREMALSYLDRSSAMLRWAREAYRGGRYPDTVRFSQEAVEMASKALLRAVGIEYPKAHDVSGVLAAVPGRVPLDAGTVSRLARASSTLAHMRGPSVYGDENALKTPEELFGREEAHRALGDARFAVAACGEAVTRLVGGRRRRQPGRGKAVR